jgi:hypothetical protein
LGVAVGILGVGGELAPAVAGKQAVHAGQRQRLAQLLLDQRLELRHHQHLTLHRAAQHLVEDVRFLWQRCRGAVAQLVLAARGQAAAFAHGCKARAHAARHPHRAANGCGRLLQTQPQLQRQQHRLRLPQLLSRLGCAKQLTRRLQMLRAPGESGHDRLLKSWLIMADSNAKVNEKRR